MWAGVYHTPHSLSVVKSRQSLWRNLDSFCGEIATRCVAISPHIRGIGSDGSYCVSEAYFDVKNSGDKRRSAQKHSHNYLCSNAGPSFVPSPRLGEYALHKERVPFASPTDRMRRDGGGNRTTVGASSIMPVQEKAIPTSRLNSKKLSALRLQLLIGLSHGTPGLWS
jgi:hypothetical protein